jgi:hypothetical protein
MEVDVADITKVNMWRHLSHFHLILISGLLLFSCKGGRSLTTKNGSLPSVMEQLLIQRDWSLKKLEQTYCRKSNCERFTRIPNDGKEEVETVLVDHNTSFSSLGGTLLVIERYFDKASDSLDIYGWKKMVSKLGNPEFRLSSSSGIDFEEFVYPSLGLALRANEYEDYFNAVDVFPPMSIEKYKQLIWNDPSKFGKGPDR